MSVTESTAVRLAHCPDFDPDGRGRHWLHGTDRQWPETNCYADLWIEVLHALGLDPVPALAGAASMGFVDDHWGFFKPDGHDLRSLYGIVVQELPVWRDLGEHIDTQLAAGRLVTLEVDSFFLPDTAGVAYGIGHTKTTIVPFTHDAEQRTMRYFHNAVVAAVAGDDHDGALLQRGGDGSAGMVPYMEAVHLDHLVRRTTEELRTIACSLAAEHLAHMPAGNPVRALCDHIEHAVDTLDLATFHEYAFATLRLCGAQADLAEGFHGWLAATRHTSAAATAWGELAALAKTAQFKLARRAAGRTVPLDEVFDAMSTTWERAMEATIASCER
jgi:hypothetical protein